MSLIPAFDIGIWNVWILIFLLLLIPAVLTSVKKGVFKKTESKVHLSKSERIVFVLSKVFLGLLCLYSIFLPLKLGTLWFYVGLPISLLGTVMYIIVSVNITTTPVDRPVTRGLYRYSRHPMYGAFSLAFIGAGIASASWLFLLLSILCIITNFINSIFEERLCLEAYGSDYQEYLNRTPRWIGIPKS
jgi:protein-S-isoprenylcysteine O-methyltransferase Ste14